MHPEMYDDDGIIINEELLSVRFIEDDDDETLSNNHEVLLNEVSNAKTKAEKIKLLPTI